MNRQYMALAGAFVGGVSLGFGAAYYALENRFGEKYAEMANANRRAYEKASILKTQDEDPQQMELDLNEFASSVQGEALGANPDVEIVDESDVKLIEPLRAKLHSLSLDKEPNAFGEGIKIVPLSADTVKNQYHKAIEATETPVEMFVEGGVNDYGVSYIEEEEFNEEDGNAKYRVDLIMDEHNPIFLLEGQPMDNWDVKLGDSILVDFFTHVPPGAEPILYVRNHRTDEDYEVVRVEP